MKSKGTETLSAPSSLLCSFEFLGRASLDQEFSVEALYVNIYLTLSREETDAMLLRALVHVIVVPMSLLWLIANVLRKRPGLIHICSLYLYNNAFLTIG